MDNSKAKLAYSYQKSNAKTRGIEWKLTFQQWLEFWGDDLDKRGRGHDQLGMHRMADSGAYELGNIRKGYPRDNVATATKIKAKRKSEKAHRQLQDELDHAMRENNFSDEEEVPEDDGMPDLGIRSSYGMRYDYVGNH